MCGFGTLMGVVPTSEPIGGSVTSPRETLKNPVKSDWLTRWAGGRHGACYVGQSERFPAWRRTHRPTLGLIVTGGASRRPTMIRINPDPHAGGYVFAPIHAVTAFFPPGEDVRPVLNELSAAGFPDDVIQAFTGTEGLEKLDPEARHHGWWVRFMRAIEDTFFEDDQEFRRAEQILKAGGSVVAVFTFKDREKKKRAAEILAAHHGRDVMYWGPILREYFLERDLTAPAKGLVELKAALELELRREEQDAANYRRLAEQAGGLALADLKAKLEGMAADEAGHARELRCLLSGL